MNLIDRIARARVFDLEQTRFAGMPIHPAHRPGHLYALPVHYAITAGDLEGCARATGVEVKPGDVLLVRTGYGSWWTDEATYLNAAGVSKSGNRWAAERRVAAVGADNMAWDSMQERDP